MADLRLQHDGAAFHCSSGQGTGDFRGIEHMGSIRIPQPRQGRGTRRRGNRAQQVRRCADGANFQPCGARRLAFGFLDRSPAQPDGVVPIPTHEVMLADGPEGALERVSRGAYERGQVSRVGFLPEGCPDETAHPRPE